MTEKEIKLVILDVDGVLTDGRIIFDNEKRELKCFSAKDGFFIKHICRPLGLSFAIITGGDSPVVNKRAEMIGIEHVYRGYVEKETAYLELKKKLKLEDAEIAFMGDDWFDWPAMKHAGYKGAPADATKEIKERVDFIADKDGGKGAVREFLESILKRDNKFEKGFNIYFS